MQQILQRASLCAFAAVAAIALGAAAPAPTAVVKIDNFTFSPQVLTVAPGTTVTWDNEDDTPHTVVANDKSFRSKAMDTDERYSMTFAKPGRMSISARSTRT
jgi:plastocyanin